jgi:hypothetical protein
LPDAEKQDDSNEARKIIFHQTATLPRQLFH